MIEESATVLSMVLPLADAEREFIERLNDKGEIVPEVLTGDEKFQGVIRTHPGLLWKALNVRQHRGIELGEPPEGGSVTRR